MPMIATTIINSISVKPFWSDFMDASPLRLSDAALGAGLYTQVPVHAAAGNDMHGYSVLQYRRARGCAAKRHFSDRNRCCGPQTKRAPPRRGSLYLQRTA